MIHFVFHPVSFPAMNQKKDPAGQQKVTANPLPTQTTEGSEFLDDALRMKEQPLMLTEISVGVGSPDDLL